MQSIDGTEPSVAAERHIRTAVLVVHGIGNQRALETVRGVVDAVWLRAPREAGETAERQIWTHPEPSGVDIDLSVMTTSGLTITRPGDDRAEHHNFDFHELYWAHLMSETRAVAVLLWLFELIRKGPRLKPGMNALWWTASIFLCIVLASLVLAAILFVHRFALAGETPQVLVLAPAFTLLILSTMGLVAASLMSAWRLATILLIVAIVTGLSFYYGHGFPPFPQYVSLFLAPILSILIARIILGWWGTLVMTVNFAFGCLGVIIYFRFAGITEPNPEWGAWSLAERWSHVVAFFMIAIYLALNALFLQSYLGDAARYFRNSPGNVAVRREIRKQAVATLAELHDGRYDRIVVVAHSLGSVVAYDMLRSYFSRVCSDLPNPDNLEPEISAIDRMHDAAKRPEAFRRAARTLIGQMASKSTTAPPWLVTDFVTLGAALTHAKYLMCEKTDDLTAGGVFTQRVRQHEYPVCPPHETPPDGLLLFKKNNARRFHSGGLFGLTRWTNLYFPVRQLLWGDAIGGPLKPLFGGCIEDVEVSVGDGWRNSFFTHTAYWSLKYPGGAAAPHIEKLRNAVNLKDE